jgi:amino acid adenylation domain-containing protein
MARQSAEPEAVADDLVLLRAWGRYDEVAAEPRCVHEMVAAQVERAPDALAISCAGTTLTYRMLDSWADGLAGLLTQAGVGRGQVVAVLADRSPELIVALLAVLKSGAAYLALESDMPAEHRERLVKDAGASIALTRDETDCTLPGVRTIRISGPDELAGYACLPKTAARPDDLAYISYTSGSTGSPRGVAVPHAAVSRLVREPDWADFTERDTFLQLAPVAFDASTLEIWAPLAVGARLAIHPAGRLDIDQLAATLATEGVTVLWLTAGLFHQVVASRLDSLGALRHLIAGGDVLSGKTVRALLTRYPQLTFTNGYGPTENTTFTTCWTADSAPPADPIPIGRPISGTRVAILDSALRAVPVGVAGELYAGGDGLARCYFGQAEATAERFVADPHAATPGARMYRTGDLARWRPDGTIDFLGRADRQVKIRGYRVELGEIEAAIEGHPGVRSALVTGEPDAMGNTRLVAFATPEDQRADPGELAGRLRSRLARRLPPHLVPARLKIVHQLPLNRNGKVDRSAFEAAVRVSRAIGTTYVAPREPLESFLAEMWAAVLGIDAVGIHDDFFEIGGHSLIAAEVLSRIQQQFGAVLAARAFYLHPTVAELTEAIQSLLAPPLAQREVNYENA